MNQRISGLILMASGILSLVPKHSVLVATLSILLGLYLTVTDNKVINF